MNAMATALVQAVMFIAYRDYDEDATVEDFENEDMDALDALRELLANASEEEREALRQAVTHFETRLPEGSALRPYYTAWMDNMFGEAE